MEGAKAKEVRANLTKHLAGVPVAAGCVVTHSGWHRRQRPAAGVLRLPRCRRTGAKPGRSGTTLCRAVAHGDEAARGKGGVCPRGVLLKRLMELACWATTHLACGKAWRGQRHWRCGELHAAQAPAQARCPVGMLLARLVVLTFVVSHACVAAGQEGRIHVHHRAEEEPGHHEREWGRSACPARACPHRSWGRWFCTAVYCTSGSGSVPQPGLTFEPDHLVWTSLHF